jgi:hypothetical protein
MSLTVKIKGDASQFDKTMRGVKASVSKLPSALGGAGIGAAVAGLAAGFVAVGKAVDFMQSASEKAAGIESLTMQFETLLGSSGAAKKRMEEIAKFAASTPFEIAELSATSKLLQTMGGNLLATGEGLRMVGDAAAISGQPLQEIGLHIGRVFNAITSGTSAGESVGRLQELGLITGTVKREFENLADAQKKGKAPILSQAEALAKLKGILSETDGAMARLAATTEGLKSNLKDNVDTLMVKFGTGFNDGLKVALTAANDFLPQLGKTFESAGLVVGDAMAKAVEGDTERLVKIGAFIGRVIAEGMKATFFKGVDELLPFTGKSHSIESYMRNAVENIKESPELQAMKNAESDVRSTRIAQNLGAGLGKYTAATMAGITGTQPMSYAPPNPFNQENMSTAVTEGVIRAFTKKPLLSTFSN